VDPWVEPNPNPTPQEMRQPQRTGIGLALALLREEWPEYRALLENVREAPEAFIYSVVGLIKGFADGLAQDVGMDTESFLRGFLADLTATEAAEGG
jgi:hypothetical protein